MSSAIGMQSANIFLAASACLVVFFGTSKAMGWLFSSRIERRRLNRAAEFGEALLQMEAEEQARKTGSLNTTMNQT